MSTVVVPDNWKWRDKPLEAGPAVVFDVDGVLADATERQHHIKDGNKNWQRFFAEVGGDSIIGEMALLLQMLQPELQVVLLTGRPIAVQEETIEWLERHKLRWDVLIMRNVGDYNKSREFKQLTIAELRKLGFELHLSFEDDRNNAEMFRAEGVPCVYIHSGYYD